MNTFYSNAKSNPLPIIDLRVGTFDVSELKILLEIALVCIKQCSRKRRKKIPCRNGDTFHYTSCNTFKDTIVCIQNITSGTLYGTSNLCTGLSAGQVSISELNSTALEMLTFLKTFDVTHIDEGCRREFLNKLRNIREALNKTPVYLTGP